MLNSIFAKTTPLTPNHYQLKMVLKSPLGDLGVNGMGKKLGKQASPIVSLQVPSKTTH